MKIKKILLVLVCSLMFFTTIYYAISGSAGPGDTCISDSDCIEGFNCHYKRCFATPGTACSIDAECAGDIDNIMGCQDYECCGRFIHPCGNQRTGPQENICCDGFTCELNVGGWYWCQEDEDTIPTEIWTTDIDGNSKDDFAPEEIVYIHGQGFSSNANVDIDITRPDTTIDSGSETTNSLGEFIYQYDLNGIFGQKNIDDKMKFLVCIINKL